MSLPTVTAIVAAYNYERFLAQTLDSALLQDYPPELLEIVIVDDGSSDGTAEVIAEYRARHPGRIHAIRQANSGYVAATNRAIEKARGQLWALLDADDIWPADKTIRQVELFSANPRLGAVYGDLVVIDAEGQQLSESHWQQDGVQPLRGADALVGLLAGGNVAGASSIMVRASLRKHFAPIPSRVPYVDWWLMLRIAAIAEIDYLTQPRVGYRVHGFNLTMGASGESLAREKVKQAQTRCQMLIRGGAARLPLKALLPAWVAVERDRSEAVLAGGQAWELLPEAAIDFCCDAESLVQRARRLELRARPEEAMRTWICAAALAPNDDRARDAIGRLGLALRQGLRAGIDPLADARSFVLFAEAYDLIERPELLRRLTTELAPMKDATLYVHGTGMSAGELEHCLRAALGRAGVVANCPAHILASADPESMSDPVQLRSLADCVVRTDVPANLRARYAAAVLPLAVAEPVEPNLLETVGAPSFARLLVV